MTSKVRNLITAILLWLSGLCLGPVIYDTVIRGATQPPSWITWTAVGVQLVIVFIMIIIVFFVPTTPKGEK